MHIESTGQDQQVSVGLIYSKGHRTVLIWSQLSALQSELLALIDIDSVNFQVPIISLTI